ncbi:MAG: hypothetical protein K1X47_09585 [Cyclobacteriaceae bacterium]|nr:hypothetical protein [Cyclobacteriaceae bacterium]
MTRPNHPSVFTLLTLLILMGPLFVVPAKGQHLFFAGTGESTIQGLQYGGAIGFAGSKQWMWGLFYQEGIRTSEIGLTNQKDHFYGIQTSVPLVRSEKMTLSFNLKGGLVNEQFVVVVPAVETLIAVRHHLQIGLGPSWRYAHAALGMRIIVKL